MANALDAIRAKLEAMDNKQSGNNTTQRDNAIFPHWNIEENDSCSIRFLPDSDPDNVFFWVERQMIKLPFPGVKGGDQNKSVIVQVPCGEMYGDNCPVLTEVRPWFKDPTLEDMGRKYWKKRSYIFQGFVKEHNLQEETPENPIRRFVISPQIFNIIKGVLMDPDMENIPTDYVNGTDFRVTKTSKGQYADYSTSKWARKESSLNEEELAAIDTHGLFNLADLLPARPTQEHYHVISEMFEASVNGELYDPEQWGNFYKPYGVEVPANAPQPGVPHATASTTAPAPTPKKSFAEDVAAAEAAVVPTPAAEAEPEAAPAPEAAAPAADTGKQSADDILALIRKRQTEDS